MTGVLQYLFDQDELALGPYARGPTRGHHSRVSCEPCPRQARFARRARVNVFFAVTAAGSLLSRGDDDRGQYYLLDGLLRLKHRREMISGRSAVW